MSAFLHNGRLLAVAIALIIAATLAALQALPRAEDPRISNRNALVLAPLPGATAERVEALIAEPLEQALRRLPELKTLLVTVSPGLAVFTLELKDAVTDTAPVWSKARDYLADALPQLPADAPTPTFDDTRGYAYTRIWALSWTGPGAVDFNALQRHSAEIQSQLRQVSGTDVVDRDGVPAEEMRVTVDSALAASLGLSLADVAAALRQADAKTAAGGLRGESRNWSLIVEGALDTVARLESLPITTVNGAVLRVGDVATVSRTVADPPTTLGLAAGQPVVFISARLLPTVRVDQWSAATSAKMAELAAALPSNVRVDLVFDQLPYTNSRIFDLLTNVLTGLGIIAMVLWVSMGTRAAVLTAISLPLSAGLALVAMALYGLPIHQMSITGLVVALGILVDNAIVLVEGIQQRRRAGLDGITAARQTVDHLKLPLLGATLTTILSFAPIALLPGPAGEFVGGIAIAVIFSLIASYFVANTLVAGLSARWLTANSGGLPLPAPFTAPLRGLVHGALRHPGVALLLCLALPASGFYGATQLTEQFFPPSDRDMFQIEVLLPSGSSLDATQQLVNAVDTALRADSAVISAYWLVGNNFPTFYYNLLGGRDGQANYAQAMVTATDFRAANRLIPELQAQFDGQFPAAQILVRKLEQGPPFRAPIELRLVGNDLATLRTLGEELRGLVAATPDVLHTRTTLSLDLPQIALEPAEEAAQLAGLSLTAVSAQLRHALDGVFGGQVLEDTTPLPVTVRLADADRRDPEALANFYLAVAPDSATTAAAVNGMPLWTVADLGLTPAAGLISRRNGARVNTIEGFQRDGVLPQTVLNRLREPLAAWSAALPAGYRLEIGGEAEGRNDAVGNLVGKIGVIAVAFAATLVLTMNSWALAAVVMVNAGQAMGLGLLSVYWGGYPFGFTVIIGLLGMMGLAINGAIIVLSELDAAKPPTVEAAAAVVMQASRHILSTTLTTVAGFVPLILAGGGFWPPFAVAIAGGTLLTSLLSLIFAPASFWLLRRPSKAAVVAATTRPQTAATPPALPDPGA